MSLLAEEIVEEWLNRQGYFTIRGIKIGVDEIDLLAIRPQENGIECRHLEIQASMRPVSYITKVPKELQKKGKASGSRKKRSHDELKQGVDEWVEKKYRKRKKIEIMNKLCSGKWTKELVINNVYSEEEVEMIAKNGISIIRLKDVIRSMIGEKGIIQSACGADFFDLINLSKDIGA